MNRLSSAFLLRRAYEHVTASAAALRRCMNAGVKEVASGLRNTPAVCRKSYINPAVFVAWQSGKLRRRAARGHPARALIALLGRASG
jgi:DNA topoisomerase IB